MCTRVVKVMSLSGPRLVNPAHVVQGQEWSSKPAVVRLTIAGPLLNEMLDWLDVEGSLDEVQALLNGTAGRAHPDVIDVQRDTCLAHPLAIRWAQRPESMP